MKGYRTIIANVVMAFASIGVVAGIEIPPDTTLAVTNGIIAMYTVVNLVLRKFTTTPIGEKE